MTNIENCVWRFPHVELSTKEKIERCKECFKELSDSERSDYCRHMIEFAIPRMIREIEQDDDAAVLPRSRTG